MNLKFNAIIFDLGGVIIDIDYHKTINAFQNLGVINFDELYSQAKQNNFFDQFEIGKISSIEFREYIKKVSQLNLNNNQIDLAWNNMLLDIKSSKINLLNQLKEKYRIFLYSNTNEIHYNAFRKMIKTKFQNENLLEDIFEKTYYSHIINKRKPNPEGFLQILNENNLSAADTLFIDDTFGHIEGANKVGLQTYFLNNEIIENIF